MHRKHTFGTYRLLFSSYCDAEFLPKAALQPEENTITSWGMSRQWTINSSNHLDRKGCALNQLKSLLSRLTIKNHEARRVTIFTCVSLYYCLSDRWPWISNSRPLHKQPRSPDSGWKMADAMKRSPSLHSFHSSQLALLFLGRNPCFPPTVGLRWLLEQSASP